MNASFSLEKIQVDIEALENGFVMKVYRVAGSMQATLLVGWLQPSYSPLTTHDWRE